MAVKEGEVGEPALTSVMCITGCGNFGCKRWEIFGEDAILGLCVACRMVKHETSFCHTWV